MTFYTKRPESSEEKLNALILRKQERLKRYQLLKEEVSEKDIDKSIEKLDDITVAESKVKKDEKINRMKDAITKESINFSLFNLKNRLLKEGVKTIINVCIHNIAFEAFLLDEDVKQKQNIYKETYDAFKNITHILEELSIPKGQSLFLENLYDMAYCTADIASDNIVTEANKSYHETAKEIDDIDFTLSDDELATIDNNLSDLGVEDIISLVKQKVIQVIQDETEINKKKSEALQELNSDIEEIEKSSKEDLSIEESFKLKNAIVKKRAFMNKCNKSSLFESLMAYHTFSMDKAITEEKIILDEQMNKMDAAYINTIFYYTVLETLSTIKMYYFENDSVKRLIEYFNRSIC